MSIRPTPATLLTSTRPVLHCCETWHVLAARGEVIPNRPKEPETWHAIAELERTLLRPIEDRFGLVVLTYGFAGRELTAAVLKRAAEGGWLPNVTPAADQHAGYERNTRGTRICKRDGFAVDLRVPGVSSLEVAAWVEANLPFDRMYFYTEQQPFHLSWAPEPVGMIVQMLKTKSGGLVPKVVKK